MKIDRKPKTDTGHFPEDFYEDFGIWLEIGDIAEDTELWIGHYLFEYEYGEDYPTMKFKDVVQEAIEGWTGGTTEEEIDSNISFLKKKLHRIVNMAADGARRKQIKVRVK